MAKVRDWQFDLPLQSEEELKLFVEKAWGVTIPDTQVCENHMTPWRAFADAYFAHAPITVWKASRGFGGKSFLLALLGLTEAATLKADVNILGGSGEQSANVLEYVQEFWNYESAPMDLLAGDVKRETRLEWGNTIKALMASQRSVRGPHRPRLRLDEVDEMKLAIFDAAMGQTMAVIGDDGEIEIPAQTVASSTHQNADGTMTEVLKRAKTKGWPVYEWCYKETSAEPDGWLLRSEIERKRSEVTAAMWQVEYDLQEPSPESRAIQPESVAVMFDEELGDFEGRNGQYIEIEEPQDGARYATGADWARKKDWTVIITLRTDCTPMRVVAFERLGRRPWPMMIGRFAERHKRYGGAAAHDATGLGDVVAGMMEGFAEDVIMAGRARDDLLSEYIAAIERDEIVAPMIDFMHGEHKYASVDDVYGRGHLPDSIAAGALAYRGRAKASMDDIPQSKEKKSRWDAFGDLETMGRWEI